LTCHLQKKFFFINFSAKKFSSIFLLNFLFFISFKNEKFNNLIPDVGKSD